MPTRRTATTVLRADPAEAFAFFDRASEPYRVLSPEGRLIAKPRTSMSEEQQLVALRWMVLSRALDEWGTRLQRMGRIGLYTPMLGQEASVVGTALALTVARDWLVPAYREQPAWLIHGLPLERLMATYMGKVGSGRIPDDVNMLPRQQSVAAQLPHAVGLAWALKIRGTGAVVLVYCGDGATSEGDFHEACNLAGVVRAPVVFVVQNNAWAISTPISKQTAAATFAVRGPGYGFPGYLVDGNDIFAVFDIAKRAVARARAGEGPTLIENRTYRMSFHNTSDNPNEYRTPTEVEAAGALDPIRRLEMHLAGRGAWNDKDGARLRAEVDEEIRAAITAAEGFPPNGPGDLFEHVYASPPLRMSKQRDQALQSEAKPAE